ncbi:MAG: hypothetical protein LBG65_03570 [Puniceicoccales bacterium]|nr:hypothetical protein [Puniceicoccales bacterium]
MHPLNPKSKRTGSVLLISLFYAVTILALAGYSMDTMERDGFRLSFEFPAWDDIP